MEEETNIEGAVEEKAKRTYKKLESVDDVPTIKNQLVHDWMQDYVYVKHPEDFRELYEWENAHQVQFKSNIKRIKKTTALTDIKAMREWFLAKYADEFPQLSKKRSSEKKEKNIDRASRLLALLEDKNKEQVDKKEQSTKSSRTKKNSAS